MLLCMVNGDRITRERTDVLLCMVRYGKVNRGRITILRKAIVMVRYGTVRYGTVLYRTVPYRTVLYIYRITVRYGTGTVLKT